VPLVGSKSLLGTWLNEKLGNGGGAGRLAPILKSMFNPPIFPSTVDWVRRPVAREKLLGADAAGLAGKTNGGLGTALEPISDSESGNVAVRGEDELYEL